jgi:hypothetical protein
MTFHACNSSEPYSRLILSAMSSSGRQPPVALLRRYRAHPSTMSCCHLLLVQDTTLGDANDCMAVIIVNRECPNYLGCVYYSLATTLAPTTEDSTWKTKSTIYESPFPLLHWPARQISSKAQTEMISSYVLFFLLLSCKPP